jgi:hypothetical protein
MILDSDKQHSVSKEAVFSAMDEMKSIGIKPTVALIRECFGDAPYSLISEYLAEWNKNSQLPLQEKFPAAPENVSKGLARLWAQARLLSDEETEQERLNLGYYRESFEKEKRDMLHEIQRLETEYKPQEELRERFDAERRKLVKQLDALHEELKEVRLNQVDITVDKQRLEREALGVELQHGQLRKELAEKAVVIKKLLVDKENIQEQLTEAKLKQSIELSETQHTLSLAQSRIETLLYQLEQQRQSAITPEQIINLNKQIKDLQVELSKKQSKLLMLTSGEAEQRSKQESLENELSLEKKRLKELQYNYSQIKSELEGIKNVAAQPQPDAGNIYTLEIQVKELTQKSVQYRNVLKDKQARYDLMLKHYNKIKKENEALRSASELRTELNSLSSIAEGAKLESNLDLKSETDRFVDDNNFLGTHINPLEIDAGLDKASSNKLKDGEEILELARLFVIEDEKKSRRDK